MFGKKIHSYALLAWRQTTVGCLTGKSHSQIVTQIFAVKSEKRPDDFEKRFRAENENAIMAQQKSIENFKIKLKRESRQINHKVEVVNYFE